LVCIRCFFAVVWCVTASGGAFACSGVTVCRVHSRLCSLERLIPRTYFLKALHTEYL
jgi:hypothetical protein